MKTFKHPNIIDPRNIRRGVIVRVLRKDTDDDPDWEDMWADNMDQFIGQTAAIVEVYRESVRLYNPDLMHRSYHFPLFVLEDTGQFDYSIVDKYWG